MALIPIMIALGGIIVFLIWLWLIPKYSSKPRNRSIDAIIGLGLLWFLVGLGYNLSILWVLGFIIITTGVVLRLRV